MDLAVVGFRAGQHALEGCRVSIGQSSRTSGHARNSIVVGEVLRRRCRAACWQHAIKSIRITVESKRGPTTAGYTRSALLVVHEVSTTTQCRADPPVGVEIVQVGTESYASVSVRVGEIGRACANRLTTICERIGVGCAVGWSNAKPFGCIRKRSVSAAVLAVGAESGCVVSPVAGIANLHTQSVGGSVGSEVEVRTLLDAKASRRITKQASGADGLTEVIGGISEVVGWAGGLTHPLPSDGIHIAVVSFGTGGNAQPTHRIRKLRRGAVQPAESSSQVIAVGGEGA